MSETSKDYSIDELMTVLMSREVRNDDVMIVGVATPMVWSAFTLAKLTNAPDAIVDMCKQINPYYTETRYPDFGDTIPAKAFSKHELEELLKLGKEVLSWTEKSLISQK